MNNFYRAPGAASPNRYVASLDGVPIGAAMSRLTCIYRDASATNNFRADLYQATQDFTGVGEGSRMNDLLYTMGSTGTPGVRFGGVDFDPPLVNRIALTNSIATQYYLVAEVADDTSFAGCFIVYTRSISPAPAVATFSDVPTSHPFFQFIEALAASGITAGCTAGEYCPDLPVTRAQMAAFFARALGLFYPQ